MIMDKERVQVKLIGESGNAFYILGKVRRAMISAGYSQDEIDEYMSRAMSGGYDNLLAVTMEYVDVI